MKVTQIVNLWLGIIIVIERKPVMRNAGIRWQRREVEFGVQTFIQIRREINEITDGSHLPAPK